MTHCSLRRGTLSRGVSCIHVHGMVDLHSCAAQVVSIFWCTTHSRVCHNRVQFGARSYGSCDKLTFLRQRKDESKRLKGARSHVGVIPDNLCCWLVPLVSFQLVRQTHTEKPAWTKTHATRVRACACRGNPMT